MTILSCQKRHHKPHYVLPVGVWAGRFDYCDGLPRWPYARPKPPRIESMQYTKYREKHQTIAVWRLGKPRYLVELPESDVPYGDDDRAFPTHAEAIAYAQNLVNERKKNSGT